MAEGAVRAFIALPLSTQAKAYLRTVQTNIQRALGGPGVRWVGEESRHLTLRFLGNTPTHHLKELEAAIRQATAEQPPFRLFLTHGGAFPNARRPRVIWVGLGGETERLNALCASLEEKLAEAGFPRETRPFSPHVTLARVAEHASPMLFNQLAGMLREQQGSADGVWFPAERLVLYRSTLSRGGAVHTEVASACLTNGQE